MIQESKLEGHKITPSIGDNFTVIRNDRKDSDGGSLITYTRKNISYIDTTNTLLAQDNTTELQSFKISTGLSKLIIGGDFNGKNTACYENNITNTRGTYIEQELQHLSILNNLTEYKRKPHQAGSNIPSPDITFCTPTLTIDTLWSAAKKLSSDHLALTHHHHNQNNTQTKTTQKKLS